MAVRLSLITVALLLGACSAPEGRREYAPTPGALYSEFSRSDTSKSTYSPFVAATLAQYDPTLEDSSHYYLDALQADPHNRFIADRAFSQLLYGGHMEDAAAIAVDLATSKGEDENDNLVTVLYILEAFKRADWPAVRLRLAQEKMTGFAGVLSPLFEAWSFAAEGNLKDAEAALEPMVSDERLQPIADEHRAYMLDYLKKYDAADAQYQLIINAEQPVSLQPFVAYAYMLAHTGKKEQARRFLGLQATRFNNNRYLLREGMLVAAGRTPSQLAANPHGAIGAMFYRLASEFSQGSSLDAAVVYLRISSYLTPEVADIYFMLGNLMDQMEKPAEAATVYAAVPPTSILRRSAQERRINALRRDGRVQEAEDGLRNALRDNPTDPAYLIALGDILRERSDFAEAILRYTAAISVLEKADNADWFAYFARGVCYEQSGDWAKAELDLKQALKVSPEEPSILNYLGYSWIDRGMHVEKAKALIEKAVELRPNDGFIIDSLGWVNFLTGDYEKAVTLLEEAVRIEPNDVTINEHLGDAYWRVGRKIEARFQWQHAIDSKPEEGELVKLRDKLSMGLPEDT
jgi:Flp pilus assembly protein TadD